MKNSLQGIVVLDTDVISNFQTAGELERLLSVSTGRFAVAGEAIREIEQWPGEGQKARAILDHAVDSGMLVGVHLERSEFDSYVRLRKRLGSGEAASIAIAAHRGYAVATDDRVARRLCRKQNPPVKVYMTEDLLESAVADGHLSRDEARQIWQRTGIADPRRGVR